MKKEELISSKELAAQMQISHKDLIKFCEDNYNAALLKDDFDTMSMFRKAKGGYNLTVGGSLLFYLISPFSWASHFSTPKTTKNHKFNFKGG